MPAHDPFHASARHFEQQASISVFDTEANGGYGAPPRAELIMAGHGSLGLFHGATGSWLTFDDACRANPRLTRDRASRLAWDETVVWLRAKGVRPVCASCRLFDNPGAGGLGAPAKLSLHLAGCVTLDHFWGTGRWRSFEEARECHTRLAGDYSSMAAWEETIGWLRGQSISPVGKEVVRDLGADLVTQRRIEASFRPSGDERAEPAVEVNKAAVASMLSALADKASAARVSQEEWTNMLRACFPSVRPLAASTWQGPKLPLYEWQPGFRTTSWSASWWTHGN